VLRAVLRAAGHPQDHGSSDGRHAALPRSQKPTGNGVRRSHLELTHTYHPKNRVAYTRSMGAHQLTKRKWQRGFLSRTYCPAAARLEPEFTEAKKAPGSATGQHR